MFICCKHEFLETHRLRYVRIMFSIRYTLHEANDLGKRCKIICIVLLESLLLLKILKAILSFVPRQSANIINLEVKVALYAHVMCNLSFDEHDDLGFHSFI